MKLRVNIFNTSSNLPLFAALARGYFARRGLEIEVLKTPNSDELRAGLAAGRFEIAHAAVDNAVALADAGHEVVIVCGGDAGMNDFMVRPEIGRIEDLRGKLLAVDAPNTAYALAAKKILKNHGLIEGRDYALRLAGGTGPRSAAMVADPALAAGMINPPFSCIVRQQGLKSLGTQFSLLGEYQATGAFVMRAWARARREALCAYLAAYVEGQRYVMDPANHDAVLALLMEKFGLATAVAQGTYEAMMVPGSGFVEDARFNMPGFLNVLAIRAEMEGPAGVPATAAGRYLDLEYHAAAIGMAAGSPN